MATQQNSSVRATSHTHHFCGDVSEAGFIEPFVGYDAIGDANEFYEACTTCQGDVNGDGLIDFADFFIIAFVAAFGCDDCPEMIELLLNFDRHPCEVECPGG